MGRTSDNEGTAFVEFIIHPHVRVGANEMMKKQRYCRSTNSLEMGEPSKPHKYYVRATDLLVHELLHLVWLCEVYGVEVLTCDSDTGLMAVGLQWASNKTAW